MLCVFGRGIEKVNGEWQPTQYLERLSEKNGHSGFRTENLDANSDDSRIVVAGAQLNVWAAADHFREEFLYSGIKPKLVAFAAGRPNYIANDPDPTLSEGKILRESFLWECPEADGSTEIVVQDKNKNTRDDLLETLFMAKARGIENVTIISVLVHLARCHEFLKAAFVAEPELKGYNVQFLASEAILMQTRPSLVPQLSSFLISKTFCRTAERERKGIGDLLAGRYDFGTQGYAFAPAKD